MSLTSCKTLERERERERKREMKHGKTHKREVEQSVPEWRDEFLAYKKLKKEVKLIKSKFMEEEEEEESKRCKKRRRLSNEEYCLVDDMMMREDMSFIQLLEDELEKVNTFFIGKEETYIIILKEMKDRVAKLECYKEMQEVQKDILEFHGEMILLLHYCLLNFTGLRKIVKKHTKKAGISGHSPFMPKVLQQPFFATKLLYRLMKECEAMLKAQQNKARSLVLKQLDM